MWASRRELNFTVDGTEVENVEEFKYLGRIMDDGNEDWKAIEYNMWKTKNRWTNLKKILSKDGLDRRTKIRFYRVLVV